MEFNAPDINYGGISPIIALTAGLVVTLLTGLVGGDRRRRVVLSSIAAYATLAAAAGLLIAQWGSEKNLIAGALRLDDLAIAGGLMAIAAAAFVIPLSWREESVDRPLGPSGHAEFQALLICSVLGMTMIAQAQNLISFFVAIELLSIPLYVLCGSALRREGSLESGLKYLIIGSLGSATLLYGLAFIYGASESTDFSGIRAAVGGSVIDDPLLLIGIALAATGLAFKLSIAPFHQWTPDVYEGAPTPVTAFMSVATKAAVFCVLVRFFDVALGPAAGQLAARARGAGDGLDRRRQRRRPRAALAEAAARLLGHRPVRLHDGRRGRRQRRRGQRAGLLPRRLHADEPRRLRGDHDPRARDRLRRRHPRRSRASARERPLLAVALTISMLALAGLPGTAGFIGKLYLIEATVDADYTWLGVMIAVGTMISLAYYLRVIAAVWMRPAAAGAGRDAGDGRRLPGGRRAGHRRALQGDPRLRAWSPRRPSSSASSPRRWSTGRPRRVTRSPT